MLARHRLGNELFTAIARGAGGHEAGQQLAAAERSKTMLALRFIVELADDLGSPHRLAIRGAYQVLADIHPVNPDAVETVIRHPAVGAWVLETAHRLGQGDLAGAAPARLTVLAAAAAIRAGYPYTTTAQVARGGVVIPSLGQVDLPECVAGEEVVIRVTADGAEATVRGTRVPIPASPLPHARNWRGIRHVTVAADGVPLHLVIDDVDPYRFSRGHNDGTRLCENDVRDWRAKLGDAWNVLVRQHRQVADEVRTIIVAITPLPAPGEQAGRSATSQDTFGCVALSRPTDGLGLAVTLAHEVQHAKLTALMDLVDLLRPDSGALFYAPWREDPRPAQALLHGSYAYLGVAAFCRRQRRADSDALALHTDYVRWREAVSESAGLLLDSDSLTDLGRRFVTRMQETVRSWQDDQVPPVAAQLAQAAALSHRRRWLKARANQGWGSKSESIR